MFPNYWNFHLETFNFFNMSKVTVYDLYENLLTISISLFPGGIEMKLCHEMSLNNNLNIMPSFHWYYLWCTAGIYTWPLLFNIDLCDLFLRTMVLTLQTLLMIPLLTNVGLHLMKPWITLKSPQKNVWMVQFEQLASKCFQMSFSSIKCQRFHH